MMNVRVDEATEELLKGALNDKELISHMRPGRNKISASALMNAVTYEFLRRWNEKKEAQRESN